MHGGAVTLARMADSWQAEQSPPDLLLATDMLDLTTFLALTRGWSSGIPVALYMHENQLTYPLPADPHTGAMRRQRGERDLHYAFINYVSMLSADAIFFNSHHHHDSWFAALPNLLKHFPDFNELESIQALKNRSSILPLGMDLRRLESGRSSRLAQRSETDCPLILWNHRWEYDKDPATFFHALYRLADEGKAFKVAICGKNFRRAPKEFDIARQRLGNRILHWGWVKDLDEYARLLWESDIVVSTALHDFFGAAVVEAIYCGCRPVLPHRLAYPEHIPPQWWKDCLYRNREGLDSLIRQAIDHPEMDLQAAVSRYDWGEMAPLYDRALAEVNCGR